MVRRRTGKMAVLLVGALVLAVLAGAVGPASAGSLFGNRSRDKQGRAERSTSPSVGSDSSRSSRSASSRVKSEPQAPAGESRGSGSIWSRSRGASSPAPAPSSSYFDRRSGRSVNRTYPSDSSWTSSLLARDETRSRTQSHSGSDRSRLFERVLERSRPLIRRDRDYYAAHAKYYDHYRYVPHYGWREPRLHVGQYYYSWPLLIEPCRFGHYVFSYVPDYACRSIYFYYGWFPYIHRSRVVVVRVPSVTYVEVPVSVRDRCDDDYYLAAPARGSIDWVLSDIRRAWIRGDSDILERYVDLDSRISVYVDGAYSYSLDARDYASMTSDIMERIDTVDMNFYSVRRRGGDSYVAYAAHSYNDTDGDRKTVYVSYTLERIRGEWSITEVGSSRSRLGV